MNINRSASIYFAFQGTAVFVWWALLCFVPSTRPFFQMGESKSVLLSFWLPDTLFLGPGSFLAAALCWKSHPYRNNVTCFVTGLVTYACFYCLAFALMTDTGWLGVVFMVPATIWSGIFSIGVSALNEKMFRESVPASTGWILLKTLTQIVVVWTIILALFPYLIYAVEQKIGIQQAVFPFQCAISTGLFVLASIPGIWGAVVMSKYGRGTPLPLDHASEFVTQGPYAYLRNPMAVSGIGQGLAVALFWGSPLTVVYALMGSAIWQLIFRPLEEKNLEQRFGEEYRQYKEAVKCWVPRRP